MYTGFSRNRYNTLCYLQSDFVIFNLGSIISWVLKPTSESGNEQSLPEGWLRCDGR